MTLEEIMHDCPSLEHFLRAKDGMFARLLETALRKAVDDAQDPGSPAAAVRTVTAKVSMWPDKDRSAVRIEMKPPAFKPAEQAAETAQMAIVDSRDGAQLHALNLNQIPVPKPAARGAGLRTEEEAS